MNRQAHWAERRIVPQMFAHPLTSRLRIAGRVTVTALAGVLVFLGGYALWSSNRSVSSLSQLKRSRLISDAYSQARDASDEERLLEHQYMVSHGRRYSAAATPRLHAQLDGLASQVISALVTLERLGDHGDSQLARVCSRRSRPIKLPPTRSWPRRPWVTARRPKRRNR